THAYVNIMFGCNNFCSYCIVPYVRGREVSRPVDDILREIEELAARGIREITLLGQNVNSYKTIDRRLKTIDFIRLLERINCINGIEKISFMTSHPKDASSELFKAMRDLDKVNKHLHLPLQSGSNRILKLMNRGYTLEKYEELAHNYRNLVPDARLTTDIIVGFPSEKEEDFDKTKQVLQDLRFDGAYIFKYSPRPPAKSYLTEDDVSLEIKKRRNNVLLELQKRISREKKLEEMLI
ncbi:MAG: MiaB/RimO family radical SAM methylthiotransferase, partial [Candidatus Omnitrophica bacterium]|nr:MiaB/RimO family radical SAM methylthiotransferase [Candidatus Omnitrophota bacterium]